MARTIERVPLDRMRRPKKPEPAPAPVPTPITFAEMQRALASLPAPQITVPEPSITVQPTEPDRVLREILGAMGQTAEETAAVMREISEKLNRRDLDLSVEITERDSNGQAKVFRIRG